jgi:hypothetical protein
MGVRAFRCIFRHDANNNTVLRAVQKDGADTAMHETRAR